jgi:predicted neuraminidase
MPPRRAWKAVSNDFGRSWKNQWISNVKNPGSSLQIRKLQNGHVVMVFNNSTLNRSGLSIALSYDEGKTWPYIREIEDDRGFENSYPSITQDRNGLIHVIYSCHDRGTIAHFVTDEEWIKSSV